MSPRNRFTLAVVTLGLFLAACGDDGTTSPTAGGTPRTIEIEMVDVAFAPTTIEIEVGETVRFVFTNTGAAPHEAVLGDARAQEAHAREMAEMDGMDHGADDDALVVDPGSTGELTHTFDRVGRVQIGCHQPGHFAAGMVLDIDVR